MRFPSGGCQTCKDRRIKCDEGQPSCQRCIKSNRTCHGARSGQAGSVLLIENSYASGKKKRPRGPRPAEQSESSEAVLYRPLIDLKTKALLYYLHDHLRQVKDIPDVSMSIGDHFMPVWRSKPDNPILDLAVSALAMATFSRTQQHRPAAMEASVKYQELLSIAQTTIPSLREGNIEACLLGAYFMSRYENSIYLPNAINVGNLAARRLNSYMHDDGAFAILKVWKEQAKPDQPASPVVKNVRRGVIRSFLLRTRAVPDWMMDGSSFGERGQELQYDDCMVRIANLRNQLAAFQNGETTIPPLEYGRSSFLEAMLQEGRDLDESLKQWSQRFPASWAYQQHSLSDPYPWPLRDFFSPNVFMHAMPAYAAAWNQCFMARMLVNNIRLWILDLVNPPLEGSHYWEERIECVAKLEEMAYSLACSIPYCLGRVKFYNQHGLNSKPSVVVDTWEEIKPYVATLCIWPLSITSRLAKLNPQYRTWFNSELARLGRVVGVGLLASVEQVAWPEL